MRCAHEVATELWDLHRQNRAYGKLTAGNVLMTESGAHLVPLQNRDDATPEADKQAFGAMFYGMLVAEATPESPGAADIRLRGALTGHPRLRPTAIKLALQCRQEGTALTMQQVATEVRLLGLLLREYQRNAPSGQKAAAPRTPFLVQAAPPPEEAAMADSEDAPPQDAVQAWPPLEEAAMADSQDAPSQDAVQAWPPLEEAAMADSQDAPSQDAPPPAPDAGLLNEPAEAGIEESPSSGESGAAPLIPLGPDSFGHPDPKPRSEPQPAGGNCPKCASPAIYVSRARSPFESTLERWGVPLCRCHRCSHRYVVFAGFKIAKQLPPGAGRKRYKPRSPLE
jgi:hypothetical protein